MNVIKTHIEGPLIIDPLIFKDARGYFFESYNKQAFDKEVAKIDFVQDNELCSSYGVIQGLNFQSPPHAQTILIRCIKGEIIVIAVDIRKGSLTYGQHVAVHLTEDNHRLFFIPIGFAHGFAILSDNAILQYKYDNYYHPEAEDGISIQDTSLEINWLVDPTKAIFSEKDLNHPFFKDFNSPFEFRIPIRVY